MSRLLVRNIDGKQVWQDIGPARGRLSLSTDAMHSRAGMSIVGGELARPVQPERHAPPAKDAPPCSATVQRSGAPCALPSGHNDHHRSKQRATADGSRAYRQRHGETYRQRERARWERNKGHAA